MTTNISQSELSTISTLRDILQSRTDRKYTNSKELCNHIKEILEKIKDLPSTVVYRDFKNGTVIVAANDFKLIISYKRSGIGLLTVVSVQQE